MIHLRKARDRGHFDFGWLKTFHTFSFGDYFDPNHMNFSSLRVINEDYVASGRGFPTHGHQNMEIITFLMDGQIEHKDSIGTGSVIGPGEIQIMSAGKGVTHSEFNPNPGKPTHLYQIWVSPKSTGGEPSYFQKKIVDWEKPEVLSLLCSGDGRDSSGKILQDSDLYFVRIPAGKSRKLPTSQNHQWLQIISGSIEVLGQTLSTSDGLGISEEKEIVLKNTSFAPLEALYFDLA